MTSQVIKDLFSSTYRDDYAESDGYYRILFNPARAVQARELTQLQTIIQSEIARFGRNIFKEGAAVNPGGPTLNTAYEYVKLDITTYSLLSDTSTIVGKTFVGSSSNLNMKILEVVAATGSDPATVYVQYLGDASSGGATDLRATAGETITDGSTTLEVQTTNTTANPAVGRGVSFGVGKGDFFALGHFIFAPAQSLIVSKYSRSYTGVVGFTISEVIVTASDNSALYDNSTGTPNTTAPGADRYKITLSLIDENDVDSDGSFIFLAKIVDSKIVQHATGTEDYNKINELLALRTKEESGNYVTKPFKLSLKDVGDSDWLLAKVSAGTAYINGYRVNIPAPVELPLLKATSTQLEANEVVAANYGNYVNISSIQGVPNVNTFEQWTLMDDSSFNGSSIGTARVRAVEEDGSIYKYYLFDVQMSGNNGFASVKSLGADSDNWANIQLSNGAATLNNVKNNNLLFDLPRTRPSSLSDISFQVQKRFTTTTDASGNASLGSGNLSAGETWADVNSWIVVVDSSGENVSSSTTVTGAGSTTATLTGVGPSSSLVEVLAYVNKSSPSVRSKTLTNTTVTGTIDSDGNGIRYLDLGKADVFDVTRIRAADSDGADLTSSFIFDNGQRDNYYGNGRLIVRSGTSTPSGNVFARFRYFAAGAGDFFAVNSYSGISYGSIPTHTLSDGTVVNLRDAIDFRPYINNAGTGYSGTGSIVNSLPKTNDLITLDATYYLPRWSTVTLSEDGTLDIYNGEADSDPKYPSTSSNLMQLYKMKLGGNTLNDSDMIVKMVNNRRYTMEDIRLLDRRIERLEEYTTLNALETSTSTFNVLDSSGLQRIKAGFLADNFSSQAYSATSNAEYKASIDLSKKEVRPKVSVKATRLLYDSDASTNTVLKGDNVYVKYGHTAFITQDQVSNTENVNPFSIATHHGTITLSPASDEWIDTEQDADLVISGGVRIIGNTSTIYDYLRDNWFGTPIEEAEELEFTSVEEAQQAGYTVVSEQTIREVIDSRVINTVSIPYMRSRKVYFRVVGLIPYQQYWAFFDNVDVSSWVRSETFQNYAGTTEDYGNRYNNITEHPDGATTLISNAYGIIEGSFFIPSTNAIRFSSGTRQFKVLNVSVNIDENATSLAAANYSSVGAIETVQDTIETTREVLVELPPPPAVTPGSQGEESNEVRTHELPRSSSGVPNTNGYTQTGPDTWTRN